MVCSTIVALAFGVASALAGPAIPRGRNCGTYISEGRLADNEKHFKAVQAAPGGLSLTAPASPEIKVYWHVVSKDETLEGGNVPDSQIEAQIAVLNSAYKETGMSWTLANTTRTVNAEWFEAAGPEDDNKPIQDQMKAGLRQGTGAALNVYTVGFIQGKAKGLLGYATFPSWYEEEPKDDGVVLLFSTVPGGSTPSFDKGHTLTHEAGHWAGLYHTFQGGCGPVGDDVEDTTPEKIPSSGCPVGRKTCAGSDGVDPINNFMDYSDDECLTEFSKGQIKRMRSQMTTFRGVKFTDSDSQTDSEGKARL